MKNISKKIGVFVLILILSFGVLGVACSAMANKRNFTFLLVGLDDAAMNTDVLCLASYDVQENRISLIQIPRDTYFRPAATTKINGILPEKINRGMPIKKALSELRSDIEYTLGIRIDGYAAITTEAFRSVVDSIGGVYIDLPEELYNVLKENDEFSSLKVGQNLLFGDAALAFVRHRSSYPGGDLSRLGVQRIFARGALDTLFKRGEFGSLIKDLRKTEGLYVDFSLFDAASILRNTSALRSATIVGATMPGAAVTLNGISYYVLNRDSSDGLLYKHFPSRGGSFDPSGALTNTKITEIKTIYNDKSIAYREEILKDKSV